MIGTLLDGRELPRDLVRITQEEWCSVNQNGLAALILGTGFKAPQNGLREGLLHSRLLIQVVRNRAIVFIFSDEQNSRTDAFEMDDGCFAGLAAVESDVIGPHAIGKRLVIKERRIPFVDLHPEFSLARVPVICEKTRPLLHSGGLLADRFSVGRFLLSRFLLDRWRRLVLRFLCGILSRGNRQKYKE
jgi:hypothetical protein